MSESKKILDALKDNGVKGDQLLILAVVTEGLTTDQLSRFKKPWKRLVDHFNDMKKTMDRRTHILNLVNEAIQQLRLDVKYLQFDLQATKQERDELKEKVKKLGG